MKSISILGTSSNAGKSWVATALCAWLKSQGVNVAPFKAQNMANNAYATRSGGEIGVAQAVQAEACGLEPIPEMNPILLKPNGQSESQIVRLGQPGEHLHARNYYQTIEHSRQIVAATLDYWKTRCDVLIAEGAGSPVELNLMDRDIVNFFPSRYLDSKWLLVSNIEMGGVFAQVVGSHVLTPDEDKPRGLGFLVNRFHGDLSLFDSAREQFAKHLDLPYLGVLPFDRSLRIDDEDSMNTAEQAPPANTPYLAWVRYPQRSNTPDQLPWQQDRGVASIWTQDPQAIAKAHAIILPGSKNPISDLAWMRQRGLDQVLLQAQKRGIPIVGICGGYQILGETLRENGRETPGLGLLPIATAYQATKEIRRRRAAYQGQTWETFEIHTGQTTCARAGAKELLHLLSASGERQPEGLEWGKVWGSYQHGLFDSSAMRRKLLAAAGLQGVEVSELPYASQRAATYRKMAETLETHLDLKPIQRYLEL